MESLQPKIPDYISEKSHLTLRLKPKGVGEVDKKSVGRKDNAGQNKFFESASYEKHCVTFVDKTRKKSVGPAAIPKLAFNRKSSLTEMDGDDDMFRSNTAI